MQYCASFLQLSMLFSVLTFLSIVTQGEDRFDAGKSQNKLNP